MAAEHATHLGRDLGPRRVAVALEREDGVAHVVERARELGGPTRAQTRDEAHELDGEVVADNLEHVDVIGPRHAGAAPAELHHPHDLPTEEHRHGDEGLEGRRVLHAQLTGDALVEVVEDATCGNPLVRRDDGDAAGARGAEHVGGDPRAKGDELRHVRAHQPLRDPAELESAVLGEVHGRAVGVERVDELVQDGVQKAVKVLGAHGGHDDRKRAGKALVGRLELREHAPHLAVAGHLLGQAPDNDEHALARLQASDDFVAEISRAGRGSGGAHLDGDERAVRELEAQRDGIARERKRQAMVRRALEGIAEEQVLDVRPLEGAAVLAGELAEAAVHVADGPVMAADGDRIARQLHQLGNLG